MGSRNFGFLGSHDPVFGQLAEAAERNLVIDPNTTFIKLRQLAEGFARHAAATVGLWTGPQVTQLELLRGLESKGILEREVASLFHTLRRAGNDATHDFVGSTAQALAHLKLARELAIWFHRTFGGLDARVGFKPGPFVAPEKHTDRIRVLEDELATARTRAAAHERDAAALKEIATLEAKRRAEAEALAKQAEEERTIYASLADEAEARLTSSLASFESGLAGVQATGAVQTDQQLRVQRGFAVSAGSQITLDEAATRVIIDGQLRAAGWEADSVQLRFALGTRPESGANRAIAEWPTDSGPADYVLFRGLVPVAVVEAKRKAKNVSGSIEQAKRYAFGFRATDELEWARPTGGPDDYPGWTSGLVERHQPLRYRVPFLFATNGRAFHRQYEQESGVWFLDARRRTNHPRALADWYTPDGLAELLAQDVDEAERKLGSEPTHYLGLRDYQLRAIHAVEEAIEGGARSCLVAMATGTGKTRTVIGLIYRLLKSQRFKRVLFLVDRSALGEQAQDAFKSMRLEESRLFSEIFELRELGDAKPDASTKVHVATVQGMVKRVLYASDEADALPVDAYDCVIVDESHRGYTLDRQMGEGEEATRDFLDYVSTYRRVLDHFDAVKVGLTATPALQTREIFGSPVFTYAYPEAVADGWLVDHEPPIRLRTRLSDEGIVFDEGEQVPVLVGPGQIDLWSMEDELKFEIESFNRLVITEGFNKVVCDYLADQLDPFSEEKTLIFCANDVHADLVVDLMKKALDKRWTAVDDGTVLKITGAADQPMARIRRFKNEKQPNIAVTVDLLSTGIDVPEIANIVFLRRVRSRILYDQMMGRATRLCDRIGKATFRIYDAVDLYAALESVTDMKPLVKDVTIPAAQLLNELVSQKSHVAPSSGEAATHADDVLTALVERLRRKVRTASKSRVTLTPEFQDAANALEEALGRPLAELPATLKSMGAIEVSEWLQAKPELAVLLEKVLTVPVSPKKGVYISGAIDEFRSADAALPLGLRPADYLASFGRFIAENMNKLPALSVIASRPRSLTRQQLKEVKLALEARDFRERDLKEAYRVATNADVAAGIIGFIRQQSMGSPLVAYELRVERALQKMLSSRQWTKPQQQWLEKLAKQLKQETVVDRASLDVEPFKGEGGFKRVDTVFEGKSEEVLEQLHEAVWSDAA